MSPASFARLTPKAFGVDGGGQLSVGRQLVRFIVPFFKPITRPKDFLG